MSESVVIQGKQQKTTIYKKQTKYKKRDTYKNWLTRKIENINAYAPNNKHLKYRKQKVTEIKGE